jgi:hypothetical protein
MSLYVSEPYAPASETNSLGLAGFICSILGLVTAGILSPIGLILSLVALGRRPRGFAIAGVVIGLVGSCGGIVIFLLFSAAILALLGIAAAIVLSDPQRLEISGDMISTAVAIEKYRDENRYLPASLGLLGLSESTLTDPWGERYRYDLKDPQGNFDLVSAGADRTFDTKDDVKLSALGEQWWPAAHIQIEGDRGKRGTVRVSVGKSKVEVRGDEEGRTVQIKLGDDRVLEISGEAIDGSANVGGPATQPEPEPQAQEEPEPPQ